MFHSSVTSRRRFLGKSGLVGGSLLLGALPGCSTLSASASVPPIIFVHGNGDNASIWQTVLWRFESNGWPRDRLFAFDFALTNARSDDAVPATGRSGSQDQFNDLTNEVARVRALTGAAKVVLVGNSRGGFAIRNYIRNGAGKDTVVAAVLGGVPNHGVWAGKFNPNSEFNGAGAFLTALNSPQGPDGSEVTPGVRFLTLRSDKNDKYAQPLGQWIGQPNVATGVSFDGPALKGAVNTVLPDRDHREVSFHPSAFAATYQFITGAAASRLTIVEESSVSLNGKIFAEGVNVGLAGAKLSVFEVDATSGARKGAAVLQKTVAADGVWGPLAANPKAFYEFEIQADGFAITHLYRSPFPRSSNVVNLRPMRLAAADKGEGALVHMNRPRGYFGLGRDRMSLDGLSPPPAVVAGVAGLSLSKLKIVSPSQRSAVAQFGDERIAMQTWPLEQNRVSVAELLY
jgi:triacylglycerol lipase